MIDPTNEVVSYLDLAKTPSTVFNCAKSHHPYENSMAMPCGGIIVSTDA